MSRSISIGKNLTANTHTVIYKVPKGYSAKWDLMYAHNSVGTNKYLTVDWYDVSTNTHVNILEEYNFTAKQYFQFSGNGSSIVLEEGDEVHMQSETGSSFGVVCTFELIQQEGFRSGY